MARRGEESAGLPSFFQDNPWLDILAQRGMEPSPDFVVSQMSSLPTVSKATPSIEPEPIANKRGLDLLANSSITPPTINVPKELIVRLDVPPELIKAVRELKEVITMALSMSQRQATIVPIYIPISVAQMAPQAIAAKAPEQTPGEVVCPKCGRPGKLTKARRGKRAYVLVLHKCQKCYLGPEEKVREKWPHLFQRRSSEMCSRQLQLAIQPCPVPFASPGLNIGEGLYPSLRPVLWVRGFPSQVKGAGLRRPWRRPAWVQIPPPAP